MCKGCSELRNAQTLLLEQLDRERERADRLEKLLLGTIEPVPTAPTETTPVKGKIAWSQMRRRLEANDLKRLKELQKMDES